MPLILPDFKDKRCLQIDLCGHIPPEEMKGVEVPAKAKKTLISRYSKSGRDVFLGLILHFPSEKTHVHLRLSVADMFTEKFPEVNVQPEEILRLIEPFLGRKIDVGLDGLFRVPQANVSSLIRSTLVESVADKVQVRMVGGTLRVRGAPIHTITWKLLTKTGDVEFLLEARREATLNDSYLVDSLELIESAFDAFVVRGSRDD